MDMCRKYLNSLRLNRQEEETVELTLEVVQENGLEKYNESEMLALCSKTIGKIIMKMMIS